MADRSILNLDVKNTTADDDTLVSVVSGEASRVSLGYIKNLITQAIYNSLQNQLHTHENKTIIDKFGVDNSGRLTYDGETIKSDGIDFSTLSNMFVEGDNISIVVNNESKTITFSSTGGIDFSSLATALTTGTQNGITVTADEVNKRFNFDVTSIPTIAIDNEGYWTVNGERGENPTKAQGEKGNNGADGTNGKDGASPTIDPNTKNWIVGTVDTGVKAEAQSNYFYTGTEFPTSDLIDGDLYLSFANDTKGNVYQYQGTTLDWSLQGNLYGGGAVIDDASTTGNTVTWSASKINSLIGDINTILASVTGGIS